MMQISVVIITKNEEKNISRCLESVKWADEIIIIDSQSEDRTLEIAAQYNAKVYSPPWTGYGPAKKEGVNKASNDWIFSIDADEEVSSKLKEEIINTISNDDNKTFGYFIPRLTNFLGRWIKHCGWYPDYVLRLFNRHYGNFNDAVIHESVQLNGLTAYLKNDLLHYSYPDLDEYFRKFNLYTTIGAEELFKKGKKSGLFNICLRPIMAFIKQYIVKLGFLDGMEGFLVCYFSAKAVMVKYAKLRTIIKRIQL